MKPLKVFVLEPGKSIRVTSRGYSIAFPEPEWNVVNSLWKLATQKRM